MVKKRGGFQGRAIVALTIGATIASATIPVALASDDIELPEVSIESGSSGGSSNAGGQGGGTGGASDIMTVEIEVDTEGVVRTTSTMSETARNTSSSQTRVASTGTAGYASTSTQEGNDRWPRLGGADRYETMSKIVNAGFTRSAWAVVATGSSFPDALAASSLAGARSCPVLLTDGGTLSPQAREQIERLGVTDTYVVGGEAAVSSAVESQLSAMGVTVRRVAGADRVATSLAAMAAAREAGSTSDTVVVATGDAFADALSIGSWCYATRTPIVLARGGALTQEAADAIRGDASVRRVIIVGGTRAVSEETAAHLGEGREVVRLAGADRYETSAAIATWAASHGLSSSGACVACGSNFPDALSGAALAGKTGLVLLLEDGSGSAARWLEAHGGTGTGYVLGGTAAVSDAAMDALPR